MKKNWDLLVPILGKYLQWDVGDLDFGEKKEKLTQQK